MSVGRSAEISSSQLRREVRAISSCDAVKRTGRDSFGLCNPGLAARIHTVWIPCGSATGAGALRISVRMATAPDLPILTDVDHNEVTLSSLLAGRRVLVLILRHAF